MFLAYRFTADIFMTDLFVTDLFVADMCLAVFCGRTFVGSKSWDRTLTFVAWPAEDNAQPRCRHPSRAGVPLTQMLPLTWMVTLT